MKKLFRDQKKDNCPFEKNASDVTGEVVHRGIRIASATSVSVSVCVGIGNAFRLYPGRTTYERVEIQFVHSVKMNSRGLRVQQCLSDSIKSKCYRVCIAK